MILNRRAFLRTGMAGFGSILLMPSCFRQASSWLFFTEAEAACVIALCEQIIPADEHGGGATRAGVIHYIDRQLLAVFDYDQLAYQQGLSALQDSCLEQYGLRFESIDKETQQSICGKLEENSLAGDSWAELGQSHFFNLLISHTMQGFYGSPRHGGNRDYMSYRMMGFDFPLVVGRNHYENLS